MTRLIVGPFNRVEGDLEVQLDVSEGRVRSARVNAPMYRGFEQMLLGREPHDALVIVPRLCGICSVSQSVAAARALAELAGVEPAPNGLHVTNLMLACENLADHLTHFYLFFMPDFARAAYAGRPWHASAVHRYAALGAPAGAAPGGAAMGEHARAATAARQRWFTLLGTLGGKWPHTQSIEPGGSTRSLEAAERLRLLATLREFGQFLAHTLFGAPLAEVRALASEADLRAWAAQHPGRGDLRLFLEIAADTGLDRLGPGPGLLMSYGAYRQSDGQHALPGGVWDARTASAGALDLRLVSEDLTHAWLVDPDAEFERVLHDGAAPAAPAPRHPRQGVTLPLADKPGAYTWNKAPRLGGRVLETGALARQLLAGQPLVRDAHARCGATVYTRVLARLLEMAQVLPLMEAWLAALREGEPWCRPATLPREGHGTGLVEAARGALGHWLSVHNGRIENYQIIAPTSWNFSPRDGAGQPGALEAALEGTPVAAGETVPLAVQHVVRSFDPCMVCTVH